MNIGSGKPVVGATLVVARSRRQPIFISLMWPDKAMVILSVAESKNLKCLSQHKAEIGSPYSVFAPGHDRSTALAVRSCGYGF